MKRTSIKLIWIAGIIFILAVSLLIFKAVDYTKNAPLLQGERIENSDSVKVLIDGQYQTTTIVKIFKNQQDSTIEYLVTELGVVEIRK